MREPNEETGLDFMSFYFMFNSIQAVKKYGKTKTGALTYLEYKDMFTKDPFFQRQLNYMQKSFVMGGDRTLQLKTTTESEAYMLSAGQTQPMQYRFKQINHKAKDFIKRAK